MKPAVSTLTISFEAPFWVGLYEREEEGLYQVCKIPFGCLLYTSPSPRDTR